MLLREKDKLAAIDLGSGGFHLAITQRQGDKLKKIAAMSENVHLSAGLDKDNLLSEEVQLRALECLHRFVGRIGDIESACVRIVATDALRQATNADVFIERANAILPVPIEIISGKEEARLIYLGIAHTCVSHRQRLAVDIGGGSTELIIGQGLAPILTESAQIGYITFTQRFFPDGHISAQMFDRAIYAAQKEVIKFANHYKKQGFVEVVGSSTAIKSIKQAIASFGCEDITLAAVEQLKSSLISYGHIKKIDLAGVKTYKRTHFPACVAILLAVMKVFGVRRMGHCDGALREGVMYDLLSRLGSDDVRDESVKALMQRFLVDGKQAKRVAKTALNLFEMVQSSLQLSAWHAETLQRAALLHEIGFAISHSEYHRHGAYMLRYADMAGFSRTDQQILAILVRHHQGVLRAEDKLRVLQIGAMPLLVLSLLLRLSVVIHHGRFDISKRQLQLQVQENQWQLSVLVDKPEYQACVLDLQEEIAWFAHWDISLAVLKI